MLKRAGMVFTTFTLTSEGEYETYDADWNYKDIPHLNILHKQVSGYPVNIGDSIVTAVLLQKVMGVTLPMIMVNYHSAKDQQTYYTSFLGFLVIVETSWKSVGQIRTQVATKYSIGSKPMFKFLHSFIRRLISKNYEVLMSEDIPMRTRRGELRKWGYTFRTDGLPHSFAATLRILDENMVFKAKPVPPAPSLVTNQQIETFKEKDFFLGRSDHWGLRFKARCNTLEIFPRMCPHEGACLDHQPLDSGAIVCPWHGRVLRPLASIPLPLDLHAMPLELKYHCIDLHANGVIVTYKDAPLQEKPDPTDTILDVNDL
jgi:hypothetical protein